MAEYMTRNGYRAQISTFRWFRRFNGHTGHIDLNGARRVAWAWLPDGRSVDPYDNAFDLIGFTPPKGESYREMVDGDLETVHG